MVQVDDRVTVDDLGVGTVRFVGEHVEKGKQRVGVELDEPKGKSDGKFGGHRYFKCTKPHGVLVAPSKVTAAPEKKVKKEKKSKKEKKEKKKDKKKKSKGGDDDDDNSSSSSKGKGKRKREAATAADSDEDASPKKKEKKKKDKKKDKKKEGGEEDGGAAAEEGMKDTAWNEVRFKGKEGDAKKDKFLRMMGASKQKSAGNRGAGPAGGLLASLMATKATKSTAFKKSGLFGGLGSSSSSARKVDVNAGSRALNHLAEQFENAQTLEKQKRKQGGRMGFSH